MATKTALALVNPEATFECSFGRGCPGVCCQNGRPSVEPDEAERIQKNLPKFLPHLRADARKLVEKEGYLSKRTKLGLPMVRVIGGWCVFFNEGCVLHKVGAIDGDKYQYKPSQCALFPLERDDDGQWYVRQWGLKGEVWDLFCLNPDNTRVPAVESLAEEIGLAQSLTDADEAG